MKNLVSINDLSRDEVEDIIQLAKEIEENSNKFSEKLSNKSLAITFFEPSTRTRIGFSLAMQKLGGKVVELSETKYKENMSSPETEEDTLKVVGDYVDILALRHTSKDLANRIKLGCKIINCGNGYDEHPTQSLIDIYTIFKHFKKIDNLSISIVGDLKNMRASHSLTLLLSKFENNKINLVSPSILKIPEKYVNRLPRDSFLETDKFEIKEQDIVYLTGFPPNKEVKEDVRLSYKMTLEKLKLLKKGSIIMNPLPRVDEIEKQIDYSSQAKYFEQSKNGLYVRMAILLALFS